MSLTAAQQQLADYGIAILRSKIPDAEFNVAALDDDAVCIHPHLRGGGCLIVAPDKTALFVASSIPSHRAIEEFRKGRRSALPAV